MPHWEHKSDAEYLAAWRSLRTRLGREPSTRELGDDVGRNASTVTRVLQRLAAEGKLERDSRGFYREPDRTPARPTRRRTA